VSSPSRLGAQRGARMLLRRLPFPYRAPTVPVGVAVPAAPPRTGIDYETAWARRWPARMARLAIVEGPMRLVVRALAEPDRRGVDRLDALSGPVVFAANHHSHLDTPVMLTSVPERWRHRLVVAAAAAYFVPDRARGAASALAMGAVPIERTRVSRRSADDLADLIGEGWSLLIFPEGGRSPDGWGQGHRGGAAYLAVRSGVPVVPVHLEGTGRILGRGDKVPRRGSTVVTFGHPMRPDDGEDARRFAARIEDAVAALADEVTTDWWTARRRAAAGATPPLTGPDTPTWRRAWARGPRRGDSRRRPSRSWPRLG
jgi:1-acyl-sn-glycerol-3-phosphate acyltransferase